MDREQNKIQAFEYLVYKLLEWYKETSSESNHNDLSILKVLKLTFFVSAAGVNKNSENTLLDIFDNYYAMPYGHVESDIYRYIKTGMLSNVSTTDRTTKIENSEQIISNCQKAIKDRINNAISVLKQINFRLITMSSFDLVDLSHMWYSWQKNYAFAKKNYRNSEKIPIREIMEEDKIYQL